MAQQMNLREYIDHLRVAGYTVQGSKGEDRFIVPPLAVGAAGSPVRVEVSVPPEQDVGALLLAGEIERPAALRAVPGLWTRLRGLLR